MQESRIGDDTRFSLAKKILLEKIPQLIGPDRRVGLKQFGHDGNPKTVLPLGHHTKDAVRSAVTGIKVTSGGTPLAKTIRDSVLELRQVEFSQRTIICLTDGENNVPPPPTMREAIEFARGAGVGVSTDTRLLIVALGDAAKVAFNDITAQLQSGRGDVISIGSAASVKEAIDATSQAVDVACTPVSDELFELFSTLRARIETLEQRQPDVRPQSNPLAPRFWELVALASLLVMAWALDEFSGSVGEKFTRTNGQLESFASDLDKLWDLRGGQ